ncbi:MAG TPA: DNA alkylation repair protein [Pyrinomonadaceae bacterium]|nr:DNA alkylation repair protein [Pyrinomonadaceae bacterium]
MPDKPKTIDEYLAALPGRQRVALEKLRQTIRAVAPKAEETISYGLCALRQNGMLVGFGARPNHCAFYLMSAATLKSVLGELKGYDLSKGTIRFQPEKPLPVALVRKLVKARLAENEAGKKRKSISARKKVAVKTAPKLKSRKKSAAPSGDIDATAVVEKLKRLGSKSVRDGMARYAIPADNAFGIAVGTLHKLAKQLGRNHNLALALWKSGWFEARMLATFVDEPERVTPAQMDRWCRDFDSWAICDTVCFHLFDRTPHAYAKVEQWAERREEFIKRGAFALLACLALHDKAADDEAFLRYLPLIEKAAPDERNFVKKGVSWALRSIGRRQIVKGAVLDVAARLAASPEPAARWIGKDALRDLTRKR